MRKALPEPLAEVTHVAEALVGAMKDRRRNRFQLEQELGYSRGYVSKLLNGTVEMRTRHLFEILRAIEMPPWEFFQLAFPPPDEPAAKGEDELAAPGNSRSQMALTERELDARIRKGLLRILMGIEL